MSPFTPPTSVPPKINTRRAAASYTASAPCRAVGAGLLAVAWLHAVPFHSQASPSSDAPVVPPNITTPPDVLSYLESAANVRADGDPLPGVRLDHAEPFHSQTSLKR